MKIGFFLARPNSYLEKEIPKNIKLINIKSENNGNVLTFQVKSLTKPNKNYQSIIWLGTDDLINPTTNVKFNCQCQSFLYQYNVILSQHNALYGKAVSSKIPKKNQKIFICKHLFGCLIYLMKNKSINNLKDKFK